MKKTIKGKVIRGKVIGVGEYTFPIAKNQKLSINESIDEELEKVAYTAVGLITNISDGVTYNGTRFIIPKGVTSFTFDDNGVGMIAEFDGVWSFDDQIVNEFTEIFYVRPAGGSYGIEDGKSYETAWSGFSSIDWTSEGVTQGKTLYVCGTHIESLNVSVSGVNGSPITIRGDYMGDVGVINSEDTRTIGIWIQSQNYITLESISSINATVSCVDIRGTSTGIITNDCTLTGSGNQAIQHLDTASATHNNVTCSNNIDDGISGHDASVIVINGGTFSNNAEAINTIENVSCVINGPVTFSGNTSHDIYPTNAVSDQGCVTEVNNVTIPVKAEASNGAKLILNNCTVSGELTIAASGNGFLTGSGNTYSGAVWFFGGTIVIDTDSDYTGTLNNQSGSENLTLTRCNLTPTLAVRGVNATDCIFTTISIVIGSTNTFNGCLIKNYGTNIYGTVNMTDCIILGNAPVNGTLVMERCFINGTNATDHFMQVNSGADATYKYCIFKNIPSAKFALNIQSGSSAIVDNCTFVGASNVGRGIYSQIDLTINNNIFLDMDIALFRNAGTFISNNSCLFNNNTDISGTVTNNDPVTTDPLLTNISTNDFSLGVGSSCIGTGISLTEDTGIDTADWGNGTDETPSVTTKDQGVNWDIGAYIS